MRLLRFRAIAVLMMALALVAACSESTDDTAAADDDASSSSTADGSPADIGPDDEDIGPDDGHGPDDEDIGPDDGHGPDDEDIGPDDGHGPDDEEVDPGDLGDVPTVTAEWSLTAAQVRDGDEFATRVICPPDGTAHRVWGTDTYSDDSSVCTAAVHIGLITFEDGGEVLIEHVGGLGFYRGSTRHGVTTIEWDSWPGSFVFIGARGVPIEGEES